MLLFMSRDAKTAGLSALAGSFALISNYVSVRCSLDVVYDVFFMLGSYERIEV